MDTATAEVVYLGGICLEGTTLLHTVYAGGGIILARNNDVHTGKGGRLYLQGGVATGTYGKVEAEGAKAAAFGDGLPGSAGRDGEAASEF